MNTPRECHRLLLFASARPLDIAHLKEIRKISVALPACITRIAQSRQLKESTRLQDIIHRTAGHMLRRVKVP
jgi:chromosome segregation and condensation protein ScpB